MKISIGSLVGVWWWLIAPLTVGGLTVWLRPWLLLPVLLACWFLTGGFFVAIARLGWRRLTRGAQRAPSFEEWVALSDAKRRVLQNGWNAYGGEGRDLVVEIAADFRAKYGQLPRLQMNGPGVYHGGDWVIGVRHPFIFDRRQLPAAHLGITVHPSLIGGIPREFQVGIQPDSDIWAPAHFEQFVDRCAADIREQLGRSDMSREEMLTALVGEPFRDYSERDRHHARRQPVIRWIARGLLIIALTYFSWVTNWSGVTDWLFP